jgi:uncharacterized protein
LWIESANKKSAIENMIITFVLALLGPVAIFVGLILFKNVFITFLLFHGLVCLGIPFINLFVIKKLDFQALKKSIGFIKNVDAIKIGLLSGVISLITIILFFLLFKNSVININEITTLLSSWNIKKNHILLLLFIMIFANSVVEEIYWRGYIFSRMQNNFNALNTIIISSLFYASYHFITTANLFSIPIGVFFTIIIYCAGLFWGWLKNKYESLYAPIISHFLADLAIMIIYLVFIQKHIMN